MQKPIGRAVVRIPVVQLSGDANASAEPALTAIVDAEALGFDFALSGDVVEGEWYSGLQNQLNLLVAQG